MTKKDKKRTGARSEPAKGPAVKDGGEDNSSAMADAARINAKEVFDSSKYNAMSDMTKASNQETKNVETLPDTKRITNSVNPEQIDDNNNNNKSITTTATTASSSGVEEEEITPKMTPMMVEEDACALTQGVSFEQLLWLERPIFSALHPFPFLRIPFLQPSL